MQGERLRGWLNAEQAMGASGPAPPRTRLTRKALEVVGGGSTRVQHIHVH